MEDVSVSYVSGHGVMLVTSVDGHGVLATSSLPVKVMSVPYVVEDILDSCDDGHGVAVMMLVSSVRHGVLPTLLTDDGQGVVLLSLSVEDMSASYVSGHGVLADTLVSLVDRHGDMDDELAVTCVE